MFNQPTRAGFSVIPYVLHKKEKIAIAPPETYFILLETGDYFLLETGDKIIKEISFYLLLETGDVLLLETGDKLQT